MAYLHIVKMRKTVTLPTDIFLDANVSVGAKGLYALIYYKNDEICSLEDLMVFANNTKEELTALLEELTECGYILNKKGRLELQTKPVNSTKRATKEEIKEYADTIQEKPKNAYEKMVDIVESYELPTNVKQLLIAYFDKWFKKEGRFAEADKLNGGTVNRNIGLLVSYHLTEEEMIKSVQESIDKCWYSFYNPNERNKTSTTTTNFTRDNIQSGTYTQTDIEEIKRKATEYEMNGKKGVF